MLCYTQGQNPSRQYFVIKVLCLFHGSMQHNYCFLRYFIWVQHSLMIQISKWKGVKYRKTKFIKYLIWGKWDNFKSFNLILWKSFSWCCLLMLNHLCFLQVCLRTASLSSERHAESVPCPAWGCPPLSQSSAEALGDSLVGRLSPSTWGVLIRSNRVGSVRVTFVAIPQAVQGDHTFAKQCGQDVRCSETTLLLCGGAPSCAHQTRWNCPFLPRGHLSIFMTGTTSLLIILTVLGQLPTKDNSPPAKNKAQSLPNGTTIPRTIPHQDNSPLGPLPRSKTNHKSNTCTVGIVLVGSCPDTHSDVYSFPFKLFWKKNGSMTHPLPTITGPHSHSAPSMLSFIQFAEKIKWLLSARSICSEVVGVNSWVHGKPRLICYQEVFQETFWMGKKPLAKCQASLSISRRKLLTLGHLIGMKLKILAGYPVERWGRKSKSITTATYRKASSRGAYGHDPLWSVFEKHRLDSTTTDITTALFVL